MPKWQMKGQMSLEMVIGLLILLVVAAVVIRIFLQNVNVLPTVSDFTQSQEFKNFKRQCEALCDDYKASGTRAAAARYCSTKYTGTRNVKQDVLNKPIESDTKAGVNICPRAVYCFHEFECQTDAGSIDWGDCRSILCQAYFDSYNDYGKASQKVMEFFPNDGLCDLSQDPNENWFIRYGFGPNPPCGGSVGTTTATTATTTVTSSTASITCSKASDTSINCRWTCPNDVSTTQAYLTITGSQQVVAISSASGSFIFTDLKPGTNYGVGLVCDASSNDPKYAASYSITI